MSVSLCERCQPILAQITLFSQSNSMAAPPYYKIKNLKSFSNFLNFYIKMFLITSRTQNTFFQDLSWHPFHSILISLSEWLHLHCVFAVHLHFDLGTPSQLINRLELPPTLRLEGMPLSGAQIFREISITLYTLT